MSEPLSEVDIPDLVDVSLERESSLDLPTTSEEAPEEHEREEDQTLPSIEEQRESVKEAMGDDTLELGETRFLVEGKWFRAWQEFVHFDDRTIYSRREQRAPGPIPNKLLFNEQGRLMTGLISDLGYFAVKQSVWALLEGWYGADRAVERQVISKKGVVETFMVEVYPYNLFIKLFVPKTQREELTKPEREANHRVPVELSRNATKEDVVQLCCETFQIENEEASDHLVFVCPSTMRATKTRPEEMLSGNSIQGSGVYQNDILLFVKGEDELHYELEVSEDTHVQALYLLDEGEEAPSVDTTRDAYGSKFQMPHTAYTAGRQNSGDSDRMEDGFDSDDDYFDIRVTAESTGINKNYGTTSDFGPYAPMTSEMEGMMGMGQPRQGIVGLSNLGNTCFMNSALQCLSNVPPLRKALLAHDYTVNYDNVLGTGGELTEAYHDLLVEMWRGSYSTVAPRNFKYTLGKHAEQFMGFDQHDSQEFLGYLLDKIHEDLNRVERKPYVEQVEAKPGEEDEKVAGLSWDNHLLRNDSIVVDIFHGQYKSVVTCPNEQCGRVSITFDPFMSLTTPLPNSKSRELVVTLIPADGSITPIRFSLSVNKFASLGSVKKLITRSGEVISQLTKKESGEGEGQEATENEMLNADDFVLVDFYRGSIFEIFRKDSTELDRLNNVELFCYQLDSDATPKEVVEEQQEEEEEEEEEQAGKEDDPVKNPDSWAKPFAEFLFSHYGFEHAIENYERDLPALEPKLLDAEDCCRELEEAEDNNAVKHICYRYHKFDYIRTLEDAALFRSLTGKFRTWYNAMMKSKDHFIEITHSRKVTSTHYYQAYKKEYEYFLFPQICRLYHQQDGAEEGAEVDRTASEHERGSTVLDVLSTLVPKVPRFVNPFKKLQKSAVDSDEESDEEDHQDGEQEQEQEEEEEVVEERSEEEVREAFMALFLRQNIYLEHETKYHKSYDRELVYQGNVDLLLEGSEELLAIREQNERFLNTPLSQLLVRGDRLSIFWREEDQEDFVDPKAADSLMDLRKKKQGGSESSTITIYDCLDEFLSLEQLEESESWYCNRCRDHVCAYKQFFLYKLPPILILHIKRFQMSGEWLDKDETFVDFPLEGLDMAPYLLSKQKKGAQGMNKKGKKKPKTKEGEEDEEEGKEGGKEEEDQEEEDQEEEDQEEEDQEEDQEEKLLYDCIGVVNHFGGLGGGHYTAYGKNEVSGKWHEFDDSYQHQVSPSSVVTANAYVLFYQLRTTNAEAEEEEEAAIDEEHVVEIQEDDEGHRMAML